MLLSWTLVWGAAAAECPEIAPRDLPSAPVARGSGAIRVQVVDALGAPVAGVEVTIDGPGTVPGGERTDDRGETLTTELAEGTYHLRIDGVSTKYVPVRADRVVVVEVTPDERLWPEGPDPGEPPDASTWLRFRRSPCLGACPSVDVTVDHEGGRTIDGQPQPALSPRRLARLQERVQCLEEVPSFGALDVVDHVWTRLEVWEPDGSRWSWVWYGGDERAPREALTVVRGELERAMGLGKLR